MLKPTSKMRKLNQEMYAVLLKALIKKPQSTTDLARISKMHLVTVQSLMRVFHEHGIVHIVGWLPNTRGIDTTPVFAFGEGEDVPRRAKTRAEIARDYRQRKIDAQVAAQMGQFANSFTSLFQLSAVTKNPA